MQITKKSINQKEYTKEENKAHAALKKAGFKTRGYDLKTGLVIVLTEKNKDFKETYEFEDFQHARDILLCKVAI